MGLAPFRIQSLQSAIHLIAIATILLGTPRGWTQTSGESSDAAPSVSPTQPTPSTVRNQFGAAPMDVLSSSDGLGDGPILAGDTVVVQVFDAPELSVKALVSLTGDIPIPLLKTFHIAGMTSLQAAAAISQEFRDRDYLRNPNILVTVQQSGNGITVAGEVRMPGVYPIFGKHRLIDVLTRAGGPTDNAAHVIEVAGPAKDQIERVVWDPTFQENPAARVYLVAGQTVMVGKCGVVYLGGNVFRPAAYSLCGSRHVTVSEAVTLAGGVRPSSSASRTVLLRNDQGTRTVRTVNLEDILRGKSPDFTLNSDDILYIPGSALKATTKTLAAAALNFAAAIGAFRLQN